VKLLLGKFLIANIFLLSSADFRCVFSSFLWDNMRETSSEELEIFIFNCFGFGVTFF
jgi:hypothetical protein